MTASDYFFCGRNCLEKFIAEPAKYLARPARRGTGGAGRDELDLPDASRGQSRQAGLLPDLRHGAGAAGVRGGQRPIPNLPT